MLDGFLIVSHMILLVSVLYFIADSRKKNYESFENSQDKIFTFLEKNIQKQNSILDKQNKEFLKVFAQVFKKEVRVELPKEVEADKIINDIETASSPEEILLTDTPRIPIVEGVKIKFEDEEEVFPMNINPIENFEKENKDVNPIEK